MAHGVVFHEFGDYKTVLKYEEITKPAIEKPLEVLIRVIATTVNPSDLSTVAGTYGVKPPLPHTPGLEGMGIIEEIGSAVTNVKVGQRVHFIRVGTWKDYIIADTAAGTIVPLPDQVSDFDGAQLTANPLTVIAMVSEMKIQPNSGEFLLQSAAGSALGRIMIQYAKVKGFKTINIVRRSEQVEELLKLGGDYVINSETEDVIAKVKEITKDVGVKYAIDAVSGPLGTQMVKCLSKKGIYLLYGRLSHEAFELDPRFMIFSGVTVRGFWLMEWIQEPEGRAERVCMLFNRDFVNNCQMKASYSEILKLLATKQITLSVETFDAKDFQAALEHCKKPGKNEKTLLLFNK